MTDGAPVPVLDQALSRVVAIEGVLAASLVEATTGLVLASARIGDTVDPHVIAASAADIVFLLGDLTARTGLEDDLEDLVLTLTGRYHVVRMLRGLVPEPVALVVTFDRPETNLAMARRELREVGEGLGA
jgi:hypothetical protein